MSSGLMMMAYVVAAVAVAAIGWLDDVRGVSPLPRLVVHALAAALFVVVLQRVSGYPIGLAGSVLAWFAIVSLLNIWNFMDCINGRSEESRVGKECVNTCK